MHLSVPSAPPCLTDTDVTRTIANHPELFWIVTLIKVDHFQDLLKNHPNQPFVQSMCRTLHKGFWPWADTSDKNYPSINDNLMQTCSKSKEQEKFIEEQLNEEVRLGQVSESFGTQLLPGMYSIPMHMVPKPNLDKLCLVIDYTAGEYSLNSMIDSDDIKETKLDGLYSLGTSLLEFRKDHLDEKLLLFKSDVSQAFHRLPMHPLWQAKQVLTFRGQCHIDCCNDFCGHSSPKVWVSFMSLVAWITIHHTLIDALKLYMEDSFSFKVACRTLHYELYQCDFPEKQTCLLQLWDKIGVPHDQLKQLFGTPLTVIGFNMDPNAMTMTLPAHKKDELIKHLHCFGHKNF